MKLPTIQELLEAGAHFGHQTRRWNPKMGSYIFTAKDGIHIIDLEGTEKLLADAAEFLKDVAGRGGKIIFVATKKQAVEIIKEEAERAGAMYLNHRWVGGLLTNWDSVQKTIRKLPELEQKLSEAKNQGYTKKELLLIQRELDKLNRFIGGIRNLEGLPDALFVVDSRKEENAVSEANKMGVPVVAIVDTNADPTKVTYPIAANDDAIKSISVIVKVIADAVSEGQRIFEKKVSDREAKEKKEAEAQDLLEAKLAQEEEAEKLAEAVGLLKKSED